MNKDNDDFTPITDDAFDSFKHELDMMEHINDKMQNDKQFKLQHRIEEFVRAALDSLADD